MKDTMIFYIVIFYTSFIIFFGILDSKFQVFSYSTTPPPPTKADPEK